jgi:tRNA (mo5U34)-methyltransferase
MREADDDPTNYWIFSPAGLECLLKRCGWSVKYAHRVGEVGRSNPVDNNPDERMFVFCAGRILRGSRQTPRILAAVSVAACPATRVTS